MEFLETVTLKQVFNFIVGAITVISVFVQFNKKIPFHPWTFIFAQIGKSLNSDMRKQLDELKERQNTNIKEIKELKNDIVNMEQRINQRFDASATEADIKEAKALRSRIIEFADGCRVHQEHTKTAFENITRDYDDYMEYCKKREIPNHFIDAEFEYIKEVYTKCQEENKFV